MAVSPATAATIYISQNTFRTPIPKRGTASLFSNSVSFAAKPRKLVARNSGDVSAETDPADTESDSSIKAPSASSSLISSLNVERALRGIAITDADHYGRLGLQRGCSYDQVTVAYQNKLEELKNQQVEEEEEELINKMELLKESYSILSSEQERRLYDWSLARSGNPDRYVWPFEVDITKPSPNSPPPQEPEDVGPTRMVGYFMLGWLILSFVLSIALNR